MTEPWWDKYMSLFFIAQLIWNLIPIVVLIFVISIYKDVKKMMKNLSKNEKDKA